MLKKILEALTTRKSIYALGTILVESVLSVLRSRYPSVTMPSVEQVLTMGGVLIGSHTITDIVAIIKGKLK